MIDVVLGSLQNLLSLTHLSYLAIGVLMGLIVGIFPGLGGIVGLSLLLPFLYGMDSVSALACLIGLVSVIPTSATFTSILMGVPGSSSSQATVIDGFAMTKKGKASQALSAAFFSSLVGGIFGALILTFFVQIARPIILLFGSAELFMLSVFGLSMVGALSGKSIAKGIASCGLGMIIGSIGAAPATGEFRMIFGIEYLYDGIPLVIVALAIFAFPEIIDLMRRKSAIADTDNIKRVGVMQGIRDVIRNKWLALRCSSLGTIIGAIPGMGGSVVDWIAYSHAKQSVKNKENLGKGDIRGVIAPESANNAKEGGALLPTLLFGIPGSGSMAVFLGGMVLIGIEAGPSMVTTDIDLTYTIIWSLAIANILGAGVSILLSKQIAKLTEIRFTLLAPFIIVVLSFASYQATRDLMDLWMFFAIGIFGVFLKRFEWSRAAFLIGFVLASQSESYLYQAVQFYGWEMFLRPGVIIIAVLTVISVYFSRQGALSDSSGSEGGPASVATNRWPQFIFALLVAVIFAIAIIDSLAHSFLGQVFPLLVAMIVLPMVLYILYAHYFTGDVTINLDQEASPSNKNLPSYLQPMKWFLGFYIAVYLIGFHLASALFFIIFFYYNESVKWRSIAMLTAGGMAFLLAFSHFLNLKFPNAILF